MGWKLPNDQQDSLTVATINHPTHLINDISVLHLIFQFSTQIIQCLMEPIYKLVQDRTCLLSATACYLGIICGYPNHSAFECAARNQNIERNQNFPFNSQKLKKPFKAHISSICTNTNGWIYATLRKFSICASILIFSSKKSAIIYHKLKKKHPFPLSRWQAISLS